MIELIRTKSTFEAKGDGACHSSIEVRARDQTNAVINTKRARHIFNESKQGSCARRNANEFEIDGQ
jgi:hypothetical protein